MFTIASAAEEGAKVTGIDRFSTGVGIRDDIGIDITDSDQWSCRKVMGNTHGYMLK